MSIAKAVLRIARPTDRLQEIATLYCRGLGFEKLGEFVDHQGFDGMMIGHPQHAYHLESRSIVGCGSGRRRRRIIYWYFICRMRTNGGPRVSGCGRRDSYRSPPIIPIGIGRGKPLKILMATGWYCSIRPGRHKKTGASSAGLRDKTGYPSGVGRRFLRALGLGIFQHAANRHDQHDKHGGADQQRD